MVGLRCSSLQSPFGIWFGSFVAVAIGPITKNIPMIECSGIFSNEIAFDCSESGFAAARTMLFPLHHNADADALITANEEGTASSAEAANPRSCRQINPRRGPLLFDSGGFSTPVSCAIGQTWNPVRNTAETRHGRNIRVGTEFVATDRLLAMLALRQVHPRHHSVAGAGKPQCSSLVPRISRVSVSAPNGGSPFTSHSGVTAKSVHPASPNTLYAPIETLFTELARRRLLSFVAQENS